VITLRDLEFELPRERIAQEPVEPRDAARLLILDRASGALEDRTFRDVAELAAPDDLFVVNDTRVIAARLRGVRASGGRVELLLLDWREDCARWRAFLQMRGNLRPEIEIQLAGPGAWRARIEVVNPDGSCELSFRSDAAPDASPRELPEQLGEMPLPPYIEREKPRSADALDYQTVFAEQPGSVAAPTAGLHFTRELAARLRIARLTLCVGPGTFRPIRCDDLAEHALEAEIFEVPEATALAIAETRARGGRVIAVGTTVVRALETTGGAAGSGRSDLFVRPGHRFRAIDALITNFHLPRSTLLALVMAFGGVERVRAAYAHALAQGYRFYSYGDAMWVR
jgi:S-adenosylmethionine:tRNA ribosyltransferase-isomerase